MSPFNATVQGGYEARDGQFVHWIKPDRGAPVQVRGVVALPEGKRVRLVGSQIEEVQ
ncbi:hypothetical protein ACFPIF_15655 [Brevundimonas faecalis]|uniref:hypothetical protein n=1 Tax=Brevundimonas faecalis TaxID=947378 RepID=UPI0036141FCC